MSRDDFGDILDRYCLRYNCVVGVVAVDMYRREYERKNLQEQLKIVSANSPKSHILKTQSLHGMV